MLFYRLLKVTFGFLANMLNFLLAGNLPPLVGVRVIVEEQGRYLVIATPQGHSTLPGGFMRWREQPDQAAQRECKEETGLQVEVGGVVGSYAYVCSSFGGTSGMDIAFRARVTGGELRSSLEGEPEWLDEAELRLKLTPFYLRMFDDNRLPACTAARGSHRAGSTEVT